MLPGSHRVWDPDRDRAEVGVSMAPADTALRAAGGPLGRMPCVIKVGRIGSGVWKVAGPAGLPLLLRCP